MTLEILSIGNELLSGHTINSNAAVIGQALLPHGFSVDKVTFLPDEKALLKKGIEEAMQRASFIITTGGLGPTGDDLTRDIVADIFNTSLVYDEA
ncbi:MAG: damage-inducible protein CinA, partial [Simkania sp.]|nr:damage-inducible protein CinA [Simkania sp.]